MSVIQFEIDDTLIQSVGVAAIKTYIEQQLALLSLQYQGDHIARKIRESGVDHGKEVREARQDAWEEYKAAYLQDL